METLTDTQRGAATAPVDAPLMIIAAAGSGKTLVLCHRILHLISKGIPPKEILAVTFTRRAGQDLKRRLEKLHANGVRVGTFHSICLSILRASPNEAGLSPNFIVFTPKMQIELLEELVGEWYARKFPRNSQDKITKRLFKSEAYRLLRQFGRLETGQLKNIHDDGLFQWAYDKYRLHLLATNAIDFCSFVRHANDLLEKSPGILERLGMKIQHVLVDEFQDIDEGQFKLLRALCDRQQQLTVVGDDDQQIYSWRGAAGIRNFSSFSARFPGCKVEKLEQNFRSTGAIVAAARSVIGGNRNRIEKTMRTLASTGELLTICECRNEQCEAEAVVNHVSALASKGLGFQDIVVLYRLHRVGLELQQTLQARGLPCRIKSGYGSGDDGVGSEGSTGRYTGEGFADVMAVLRLILNESDEFSCKRVLGLLCPVELGLFPRVRELREKNRCSFLQVLKAVRCQLLGLSESEFEISDSGSMLGRADSRQRQQVVEGIQRTLRIVSATREELQKLGMKDVVMNLLQQISPYREEAGVYLSGKENTSFSFAGIKALLKEAASFDLEAEHEAAKPNASNKQTSYKDMRKQQKREPGNTVRTHGNYLRRLRCFLDQVAMKLHEHELGDVSERSQEHPNTVTLSTIHQAKGLEWTSVILIRANDGVMPIVDYDICEEHAQEERLEEERRLMYVALTRAKRSLFITHLVTDGGRVALPSRFLADIPRGLVCKSSCYEPGIPTAAVNRESANPKQSRKRLKTLQA